MLCDYLLSFPWGSKTAVFSTVLASQCSVLYEFKINISDSTSSKKIHGLREGRPHPRWTFTLSSTCCQCHQFKYRTVDRWTGTGYNTSVSHFRVLIKSVHLAGTQYVFGNNFVYQESFRLDNPKRWKCAFANKLQLLATPPKNLLKASHQLQRLLTSQHFRGTWDNFSSADVNPVPSLPLWDHGKMRVQLQSPFSSDDSNPSSLEI